MKRFDALEKQNQFNFISRGITITRKLKVSLCMCDRRVFISFYGRKILNRFSMEHF